MHQTELVEGALTRSIIHAFYEVYNTLDFGFQEHIYTSALEKELRAAGHKVEREVRVVVFYKGEPIAVQVMDMVVDGKVIVEVKSTANLHPSAARQLENYLRATDLKVGLLLHFGLEARFQRSIDSKQRRRRTKPDADSADDK